MADSIYHFKNPNEFKHFIHTIADQSLLLSEALATYREFRWLPNKFRQMRVQQLSDDSKLIIELDEALRHAVKPQAKFEFPWRIEDREQELIDNIAELYPISKSGAKAKIVSGHYVGPAGYQQFNYCLEVVMAPRTDKGSESAGDVIILGNINSTPSIDGGSRYFDSAAGVGYYWNHKGSPRSASSLGELLMKCGFDTSVYKSTAKKRVPCVLYVNLFTPGQDWLGAAGKTHIDLKPYAYDIAEVVSSLAYKMPSYYGKGFAVYNYSSGGERHYAAKGYLKDFLRERWQVVQANRSLIKTDPLTQQSVFYRIRPKMIENDFRPRDTWGKTREYLAGLINEECAALGRELRLPFTLTREHLGIHAGGRADMLYNGETYPITKHNIQELAKKGVAFVVIEKEGIAAALAPYAENYGVAIVNTRGIFVEAVKDIIDAVNTPLGILTDYDAHGVAMATRTRKKEFRIGIDINTIEWLRQRNYDIELEDVEEEYSPGIRTTNEYLSNLRIELDSIVAKIGREPLWEYVVYRMEEQFKEKGFDYTKVIERPADATIYPDVVADFLTSLNIYLGRITQGEWDTIQKELTGVEKFLIVSDKEDECIERLEEVAGDDKVIQQTVIPKVKKLFEELSGELQ